MPAVLSKQIGEGRHATVRILKLDNKYYAAKCFLDEKSRNDEFLKHLHIVTTLREKASWLLQYSQHLALNAERNMQHAQTEAHRAEIEARHARHAWTRTRTDAQECSARARMFDANAQMLSAQLRRHQADVLELQKSPLHHYIADVIERGAAFADRHLHYYIVLRLEGQSMEEQMTSFNSPPPSLRWMILEYGRQLCRALFCMHLASFHYDINPANILQKGKGYGYVIVDFGQSERRGARSCKNRDYSQYAPLDPADRIPDGKFDVASLASVLLELFVWGFFGRGALLQFRVDRRIDQVKSQQGQDFCDQSERFYIQRKTNFVGLSPSVNAWLERLKLEIPQQVVEVLRRMLDPNPDERPTASSALTLFEQALPPSPPVPPQKASC